jgi:hypothetical protein
VWRAEGAAEDTVLKAPMTAVAEASEMKDDAREPAPKLDRAVSGKGMKKSFSIDSSLQVGSRLRVSRGIPAARRALQD